MRLQDMASGRKDLYMMDPALLCEDPGWNVRQDGEVLHGHIRELADSIKGVGVLEPLTVYLRDGKPYVTNGFCRLAAVRLAMEEGAEIKAVPVRVEDRSFNDADRVLSMITRNSGLPLTPLEKSAVVKRLLGYGWQKPDIVAKTGLALSYVNFLCSLAALDPEIQAQIARGELSADTALKAVQSMGPEMGKAAIGAVVDKAKAKGKTKATPKDFVKPAVVEISERLAIPAECITERKGEYSLTVRNLDESSLEEIVRAVRDAGYDIV